MIRIKRSAPAIGLLSTVLVVAAFAALSAVLVKVFVSQSRISGGLSASQVARNEADQGLQEGLLRYDLYQKDANSDSLNAYGEYGVGAVTGTEKQGYSLTPMRRGFTDAGTCADVSDDQSPTDPDSTISTSCPYYDLTVRSRVSLAPGQSVSFPEEAFHGATLTLNAWPDVLATSKVTFTGGSYSVSCQGAACPDQTLHAIPYSFTFNSQQVQFVITNTGGPNNSAVVAESGGPSNLIIDKGFTTIDSIGYAGGVRQQEIATLYTNLYPNRDPDHNGKTWIQDTDKAVRWAAETFDKYGCTSDSTSTCTDQ